MADKIADKSENVLSLEKELVMFLDCEENKIANAQNTNASIKLMLEDLVEL